MDIITENKIDKMCNTVDGLFPMSGNTIFHDDRINTRFSTGCIGF